MYKTWQHLTSHPQGVSLVHPLQTSKENSWEGGWLVLMQDLVQRQSTMGWSLPWECTRCKQRFMGDDLAPQPPLFLPTTQLFCSLQDVLTELGIGDILVQLCILLPQCPNLDSLYWTSQLVLMYILYVFLPTRTSRVAQKYKLNYVQLLQSAKDWLLHPLTELNCACHTSRHYTVSGKL